MLTNDKYKTVGISQVNSTSGLFGDNDHSFVLITNFSDCGLEVIT